jgi:hypothetical protein
MKPAGPRRIFLGTYEIAGYYSRLAGALREQGAPVQFVTFEPHRFGYGGADETFWIRLLRRTALRRASASKRLVVGKVFWIAMQRVARFGVFLQAALGNDVFIFGFGTSLLPRNLDLLVLRALRKTIIVNMAHGSELRPPYLDGIHQDASGGSSLSATGYREAAGRHLRRLRRVERHADYVIGAPYTSQFCRRRLINMFALGVPAPSTEDIPREPMRTGAVRIVHAPSNAAVKGTDRIRSAIESLRRRGHVIDYVELQGRLHEEVLRELADCDLVVDQIYSDTPMAGLAIEAAAFGKPTVVGGYELEALRKHVPDGMFPPSFICHPDGVESALDRLIRDGEYRARLGEDARRFVTTAWCPAQVARRYLTLMEGKVPESWWFDPLEVCYVRGGGQSEERTRANVQAVVEAHGVAALALGHRPDVERALLEFSGLEPANDASARSLAAGTTAESPVSPC